MFTPKSYVRNFRQSWQDDRLALSRYTPADSKKMPVGDEKVNIDASYLNDIWRPDIFFVDSRKQERHSVMTDNVMLDITTDGTVTVSERLTIKLLCEMDYSLFPFDNQLCPLKIESYALRDHQIKLKWASEDIFQETD